MAQYDSVGTFIAVINQVMGVICPKYTSHEPKRTPEQKAEDNEQWNHFVGVATNGDELVDKCLPHLKAISLIWGRDKIQHYHWYHRGGSFHKKLGAVSKMMPWEEFVTKANRLLWRRATMDRKFRRCYIRPSPDPLDENELRGL